LKNCTNNCLGSQIATDGASAIGKSYKCDC
jgi:hypothetical protein